MKSEILAKVTRGGTLESIHRGTLIVIEGDGKKVFEIGDASAVTFWRSAAKALQAVPLIASGAADRFGFTEKEIALACASHSGESFHTELAEKMLAKIGLEEKDLRCGSHPSFHEETAEAMIRAEEKPTQLNNNCSGKHAGMLAFAKQIGADLNTYLKPENPVQKAILEVVSLFTEIPINDIRIGIDGCSAPNFAVPIKSMALAYAKLINPRRYFEGDGFEFAEFNSKVGIVDTCERIVSAKMNHPEFVGGSVRLDSKIMKALPQKIVCKVGAEGIWSAGILPSEKWKSGLAIAIKIDDGNDYRARPVIAIELLRQLGVMSDDAEKHLDEYSPMVLKNRMELEVGNVFADFRI